jgi:hypothetical protein
MNSCVVAMAALWFLSVPAYGDPISGYVYADGTAAVPSSLYSVSHPKEGVYIITFTSPMPRGLAVL